VRVAALYDIHGNTDALQAVLADIAGEGVDLILVGGDVVAGPFPAETLQLLRAREDVAFIRGNADRELAEGHGRMPDAIRRWLDERIDAEIRATLGGWQQQVTLEVDGLGATLFCHATARNDEEIFTELTPDAVIDQMFAGAPPVAVVGHTHMQIDRMVGSRRIVNAGSVGLPYEARRGAYWALLGPDASLRRTEYDVDAYLDRVRTVGFPADDLYLESLVEPSPRREVAAFFERAAGRGS
jgi:predicted phosphodiesterase